MMQIEGYCDPGPGWLIEKPKDRKAKRSNAERLKSQKIERRKIECQKIERRKIECQKIERRKVEYGKTGPDRFTDTQFTDSRLGNYRKKTLPLYLSFHST